MLQKKYSVKILLVASFGSFLSAAAIYHPSGISPVMAVSPLPGEGRPPSFASVAKRSMPYVVNISTTAQKPSRTAGGGGFCENRSVGGFFSTASLGRPDPGRVCNGVWGRVS